MYNLAVLVGRLTRDPELKATGSGTYVTGFSVAVDRRFSGKDGERKADFINITAWRQQAEFVCKYFHKGDAIGIQGSIQARSYEDRDGNKRIAVEVMADNVFFVGGKTSGGSTGAASAVAPPMPYSSGANSDFEEVPCDDDDLPF